MRTCDYKDCNDETIKTLFNGKFRYCKKHADQWDECAQNIMKEHFKHERIMIASYGTWWYYYHRAIELSQHFRKVTS